MKEYRATIRVNGEVEVIVLATNKKSAIDKVEKVRQDLVVCPNGFIDTQFLSLSEEGVDFEFDGDDALEELK